MWKKINFKGAEINAKKTAKKYQKASKDFNKVFRLYNFYDEEDDFGSYYINELNPEKIENLLDKYRSESDGYNPEDFCSFLEENGYVVIEVECNPDFHIYF